MNISLTKKQIKDLNVNGFTIIEKVLDKKSLLKVSKAMDTVAEEILKNIDENPAYIDGQFYGDGVKLRNCISRHKNLLDLFNVIRSSTLFEASSTCLHAIQVPLG